MAATAESLMLTQYVWHRGQFNAHTICLEQQKVQCSQNMCGTADNLIVT
jgi:hypothetical protein